MIRGVEFKVHEALHRSLAHASYHVGQMVFLAKTFRGDAWKTLSIARGASRGVQRESDRNAHGTRLQSADLPAEAGRPCGRAVRAASLGDKCSMDIEVRPATPADAPAVAAILAEVDAWVAQLGTPMWELGEVERGPHRRGSRPWPVLSRVVRRRAGWHRQVSARRPASSGPIVRRQRGLHPPAGGAAEVCGWTGFDGADDVGRRAGASAPPRRAPPGLRRRPVVGCAPSTSGSDSAYHSDRQVGPYLVARYEYPAR